MSYQRYSIALLCIGTIGGALGLFLVHRVLGPNVYYQVGGAMAVVALASAPLRFGIAVGQKWPRKFRATMLACRRIEQGRFSVKSIQRYCEDPCFRVVAAEILTRAGVPKSKRKSIVRNFSDEASKPAFVVFVNPAASKTIRVEGALFETSENR